MRAREREFALPCFTLAAREWGDAGGIPMLALHGWLDNAASFDLLAPLLEECHLLALDLAGHGRSGFRSADSGYNIWQDVGDVIAVADQMGWARFTLLGHSRGAAIATLAAGTFPARVESLVLLEGGIALPGEARDAPESLARALQQKAALHNKSGRIFADRATAIAERASGARSAISLQAAERLAERSLREVAGGFQWHADQRLKGDSELRLTVDHLEAFIARVDAPVLLLTAEASGFRSLPIWDRVLLHFKRLEEMRLPGGHHFHLEGAEVRIAEHVRRFLRRVR